METKILQRESPLLRANAKDVPASEITSSRIKKIIKDMNDALSREDDGVAIAAPQIGVPLRIFLVSKRAFEVPENVHDRRKLKKSKKGKSEGDDLIFINPVIKKLSREKRWMDEGCLSVRWAYGKAERSVKATIEAYDVHGQKFTRGASGLLAQIFQHETDHLNGILFTDKARDVREIPPEEQKKIQDL